MEERLMALEIANAIVNELWLQGLITDSEKDKAIEMNKVSFTSTNY